VFFHDGNSLEILPRLVERGERFDVFHIDGAKRTYPHDVRNCRQMIAGEQALLIMDDTQLWRVGRICSALTADGVVEPLPDFPRCPKPSDTATRSAR
jgi:hypothetical protein